MRVKEDLHLYRFGDGATPLGGTDRGCKWRVPVALFRRFPSTLPAVPVSSTSRSGYTTLGTDRCNLNQSLLNFQSFLTQVGRGSLNFFVKRSRTSEIISMSVCECGLFCSSDLVQDLASR